MNEQIDKKWRDSTEDAIKNIKRLLKPSDQDYKQDFLKLATWITEKDYNGHGFMPRGFESSKSSAQDYENFLHALHHSMCDDGDLSFVKTKIHGSFMVFVESQDTETIKKIVNKTMGQVKSLEYTVHCDVDEFIKHVDEYNNQPLRSSPFKK